MEVACGRCGEHKGRQDFYKCTRRSNGLDSYCKECRKGASKAQAAVKRDCLDRKVKKSTYDRSRYVQMVDAGLAPTPERKREIYAKWYANNKPKAFAKAAKRRAGLHTASVKWANQTSIEQWYELANQEALRLGVACHVDHIVPLVHPLVCGLHNEYNLQVLTANENWSKQNKFTTDWN